MHQKYFLKRNCNEEMFDTLSCKGKKKYSKAKVYEDIFLRTFLFFTKYPKESLE